MTIFFPKSGNLIFEEILFIQFHMINSFVFGSIEDYYIFSTQQAVPGRALLHVIVKLIEGFVGLNEH